jgi:hypothetical protein
MWDHCNNVRLNMTSPSDCRVIEDFNHQIREEFALGIDGIAHGDHHWLAKPIAHILEYDKEHQAQWLVLVDLAQYRFTSQAEFSTSTVRKQRKMMEAQFVIHERVTSL